MYNVAVVGAGIGAQHCDGFAALPERFRIHTICDLDEAKGGTLAAAHGAALSTDLNAVIANPDIDIIDICLPPHLHFDACITTLDAGKTVICEKPLVTSLRETDLLQEKVLETGGQLFPVFQYRYGIGAEQLRALIHSGLAGRCYAGSLETHWNRDADYYSVPWRGTWAGERGGAILGHAIHIHDLLTSFLGPVASVYAETATRVNPIETEDCAALAIRMESGAVVTSSVTLGCAEDMSCLRLMFEGFTVESDHTPYAPASAPWKFLARAPTTQSEIDSELGRVRERQPGYAGMFDAIADALSGQGGREVTLDDARRSLEFVTAVYASARSGERVSVPLTSHHPMYDGWAKGL